MPKTAPAPETSDEAVILFDRTKTNVIPLSITKNGRTYRVEHTLRPLTDQRYYQAAKEMEDVVKRATRVSTEPLDPWIQLWDDLAESVKGYAQRDDWRKAVHYTEKVQAVNALIHVEPVVDVPLPSNDLELDDRPVEVSLNVLQSGVLIRVVFQFREETQKQLDRWIAIEANSPSTPGVLASSPHLAQVEKLNNLGKELLISAKGYEGEIPAWHLAIATRQFFGRQQERVGKL